MACGAFDNYVGGMLLRFTFVECDSLLLVIQSDRVFDLFDRFEEALPHFRKHGFVCATPIEATDHVALEDFEVITSAHQTVGTRMQIGSDGIRWVAITRDGAKHALILRPSVVVRLHASLEYVVSSVVLIDLRPFQGMSWRQMTQELEKLPGYLLRHRMVAFNFSLEIFRRNATLLTHHLRTASGPLNADLIRWDRRFHIDTFLRDAIHLLFNFVAAAKALSEHSRVFYRKMYQPRKTMEEYQGEIDRRFVGNGRVAFMHGLRDHMAHASLIGLQHERTHKAAVSLGRVVMNRDEALAWDKWSAVAKKWLRDGPVHIDILETTVAFVQDVEEFQEWYMQARERVDRNDFRYAEQLRKAILARKGLEEIPELGELLKLPPPVARLRVRAALGAFLTPEQLFELRHVEEDVSSWLQQALPVVRELYPVPETLAVELLAHMAG